MKKDLLNLLLVDNHDSFTWNLVELFRTHCKCNVKILISEEAAETDILDYDCIVFSPGPGLPEEQQGMFRVLEKVEKAFNTGRAIPVLGVCLGMQAFALRYGATLKNLEQVIHGQPRKLSILKKDHFLFNEIEDNTVVGLYHSWAVARESIPSSLEILAESDDGTIMALQHRSLPVCGVQFHPESVITLQGIRMMRNWAYDVMA